MLVVLALVLESVPALPITSIVVKKRVGLLSVLSQKFTTIHAGFGGERDSSCAFDTHVRAALYVPRVSSQPSQKHVLGQQNPLAPLDICPSLPLPRHAVASFLSCAYHCRWCWQPPRVPLRLWAASSRDAVASVFQSSVRVSERDRRCSLSLPSSYVAPNVSTGRRGGRARIRFCYCTIADTLCVRGILQVRVNLQRGNSLEDARRRNR